jgi:hypothetical protein
MPTAALPLYSNELEDKARRMSEARDPDRDIEKELYLEKLRQRLIRAIENMRKDQLDAVAERLRARRRFISPDSDDESVGEFGAAIAEALLSLRFPGI